MKKVSWQTWLLIAWPYSLFLVGWIMTMLTKEAALICLGVWTLTMLGVCMVNVGHAFAAGRSTALQGMVVKLAHIPFYTAALFVGVISFAAPPLVLGLFLLEALLMLTSSIYGLKAVWRAFSGSRMKLLWALLLVIGHLLFVADTVCSVILYVLMRREEG